MSRTHMTKCLHTSQPSAASRSASHGFTLIELLVVISIIALLIAILLPALESARTAARIMKGTSQARQIQIGLAAYSNDYDGLLPFASGNKDDNSKPPYWNELLIGEVPWFAPGANTEAYLDADRDIFYSPGHTDGRTLRWSGFGVFEEGAMPTLEMHAKGGIGLPFRYGQISEPIPAELLTIADNTSRYPADDGRFRLQTKGDSIVPVGGHSLFTYNGRLIRAYADGHASSSDSKDVHWVALGRRTGFFDTTGDGNPGGEIRRAWIKPWYARRLSGNDATY